MKNVAFDEKIDGTVHLAVGNSYTSRRDEHELDHWDIVKDLRAHGELTPTASSCRRTAPGSSPDPDSRGLRTRSTSFSKARGQSNSRI